MYGRKTVRMSAYKLCFMYNTSNEKTYDKTQLLSHPSSMLNEWKLIPYPTEKTCDKMNIASFIPKSNRLIQSVVNKTSGATSATITTKQSTYCLHLCSIKGPAYIAMHHYNIISAKVGNKISASKKVHMVHNSTCDKQQEIYQFLYDISLKRWRFFIGLNLCCVKSSHQQLSSSVTWTRSYFFKAS